MASNEGKACDAAVRFIEQRTGAGRTEIRWPERDHVGPPVELRLKIRSEEYAIEHTRIEPFENQIGRGVALERLVGPAKKASFGNLPGPAYYTIWFPSDRKLVVKKSTLRQQQERLKDWVHESAPRLYEKLHERIGRKSDSQILQKDWHDSIKGKLGGFPYEIQLACVVTGRPSGEKSGKLVAGRCAPKDLEVRRLCRMRRTLDEKLPKLQKCKNEGARTVLVLESDDIALTTPNIVRAMLVRLHGECAGKLVFPDEIVFVGIVSGGGPWWVWHMKHDGKRLKGWSEPTGFRVDELTDLTRPGP